MQDVAKKKAVVALSQTISEMLKPSAKDVKT